MIRKLLPIAGLLVALGIAAGCGTDAVVAPASMLSYREAPLTSPDLSGHGQSGGSDDPSTALGKPSDPGSQPSDTALINPGEDTVLALKRPFNLTTDISESAEIGPQGGEININAVGGKIDIPPGALREKVRITITAKAGWNVAYEFLPHGISFDKPVKIQQDLKYTTAYRVKDAKSLTAGYYSANFNSIFLDPWRFFARVSELRHVEVDKPVNPRVAKFYIYHFSGYLMSSGFKGGLGNGDGDGFGW
jgi:hypothetical protein